MLLRSACGIKRRAFSAGCADAGAVARESANAVAGAAVWSIRRKPLIAFPVQPSFVPKTLRDPYPGLQCKSRAIDFPPGRVEGLGWGPHRACRDGPAATGFARL